MDCLHGLEREALRVDSQAFLSKLPHPPSLGSPLMHPSITTDFSEAQVEYTSQPCHSLGGLLSELGLLCHYVRRHLEEERLWPLSMPARILSSEDIPLAQYGSSPQGRQKRVYRRGLAHRYGRAMQSISGVHYNISFGRSFWQAYGALMGKSMDQQAKTELYLAALRNILRHSYVFPYLFGDSPAVDESFLRSLPKHPIIDEVKKRLLPLPWEEQGGSFYAPHASSLRQSELGYNHPAQWDLNISYNSLQQYIESMRRALGSSCPAYEKWPQGEEQLSSAFLQIENEHYALVRPKAAVLHAQEGALAGLGKYGIEYLELRCLDIQARECHGIDIASLAFMQLLVIYCALTPSNAIDQHEQKRLRKNYLKSAWEGLQPSCTLALGKTEAALAQQGEQLCRKLEALAERLDQELVSSTLYQESLSVQKEKFRDAKKCPAAMQLAAMQNYSRNSYLSFGQAQADQFQSHAKHSNFPRKEKDMLDRLAQSSLAQQKSLEKKQGELLQPAP